MLASLPQDVLDKVGELVADGLVREYALVTCCRTNPRLPLRPLDAEDDLGVAGIAVDGGVVLVRGATGGFLGEPHVSTNEGYFPALDNGEWYSQLHFDADGLGVDYARTPGAPGLARHRFFRDARDGAATVRLGHSDDEVRVLEARHRPIDHSSHTARGYNAALKACEALVEHDVDFRYLRVPGARACALNGRLRIASLSTTLPLGANLAFVGALPLRTRLEVPHASDARAFPPKVRKQLAFTLDKVLVLAPREWLHDRAGSGDDARDGDGYCANAALSDIVFS